MCQGCVRKDLEASQMDGILGCRGYVAHGTMVQKTCLGTIGGTPGAIWEAPHSVAGLELPPQLQGCTAATKPSFVTD